LVILCVDAINESPRAKELLRQLDGLVQDPWPWLKVVVSSRPETWQAIKGGVKLAEAFYYREKGSRTLEVELEPFSYSERMEPFSRQELPEAYAKYRQAFKLQTEYEALPRELREALREPLNLWLVGKTYEGQAIPDPLEVTELIAEYADALLPEEDLRFLERQLVPLMVREGQYSNVITTADIDAAGGGLYEAIYSEQVLSDGRRVNQSFLNLVDTDILVKQEEGKEQKIAFKYERFYDYFVGRHLFEEYERSADKAAFLERWVAYLNEAPFLWGALRHLLVNLLKGGEYALLERLGYTTDVFQCQLVVSVLTEYYPKYQDKLDPILERWLESKGDTLAVRITASVAMACEIEDILERMLVHPVEMVRFYVVQDIHRLWKKNPELTSRLLHKLPERINLLRIRYSLDMLSTLLRASLLLVLRDYASVGGETETVEVVQDIWSPIIERFLFVSDVGFIESGLQRLRRGMIRVIIGQVTHLIRNIEREGFTFSFRDMEAFFPASEHQERILRRLIPHIDAAIGQAPESVEELTAYIEDLARSGEDNFGIVWAALAGLTAHIHHDPLRTAQALDRLFESLEELYPPTTDVENPTASIWYAMMTVPFLNFPYVEMERELVRQILEVYMKTTRTREFRYRNRWRFSCGDTCRVTNFEQLLFGYALGIPEAGLEMLESIARFNIEQQDHEQIRWSVYSIAIGMERYKLPNAGVQALYDFIQLLRREGYLDQLDEEGRARFWRTAADDLVKYGGQHREQWATLVEMFDEGELPSEFRVRVLNPGQEYNIDLNMGEAIAFALVYGLEDENPFVRDLIKWAFYRGLEADGLADLLLELMMRLINLIYVLIIVLIFFLFVVFYSELKNFSRMLISLYGYWGLFLSVVVLDIPIQPISPVVLALGATFGGADLMTASLVGGMGSCLAGVVDYSVGAKVGARGFKRWFGEEHLTKGEELFEKYGVWAVMMGAVSPVPYSAVCWTAGIYRMKFSVYLITIFLTRIPYFFFGSLVGFLL
jgi:membrane protein YqaA with SNARE-associated domain